MATRSKSIATPLLLTALGVALLLGCIPIPATHQLQPDGKPRPEWTIGHEIKIGETHINDAMAELNRRVPKAYSWNNVLFGAVMSPAGDWTISPDKHSYALHYSIRTATWIYPLCFAAQPSIASRWLVLKVNDAGIVVGSKTVKTLKDVER